MAGALVARECSTSLLAGVPAVPRNACHFWLLARKLDGRVVTTIPVMAIHIHFQPGEDQSVQAAQYFREVASTTVSPAMEGMEEQDHLIPGPEGVFLHLRIWSQENLDEQALHELFDHLLAVRSGLQQVQEHPVN